MRVSLLPNTATTTFLWLRNFRKTKKTLISFCLTWNSNVASFLGVRNIRAVEEWGIGQIVREWCDVIPYLVVALVTARHQKEAIGSCYVCNVIFICLSKRNLETHVQINTSHNHIHTYLGITSNLSRLDRKLWTLIWMSLKTFRL